MCLRLISFPIINSNKYLKQFFNLNNDIDSDITDSSANIQNTFFKYFFLTYFLNSILPKLSITFLEIIRTKNKSQKLINEITNCFKYNYKLTLNIKKNVNSLLYDVFLGGSCGNTVWRQDLVIPYLKKRGITYYNPQRSVWSENLIYEEAKAKKVYIFF